MDSARKKDESLKASIALFIIASSCCWNLILSSVKKVTVDIVLPYIIQDKL
jgi:hypothetical protein